jgi:lipid-binding SYLF domain-containing protein
MTHITRIFILLILIFSSSQTLADKYSDAITNFKNAPELQPFFSNAYGYAVFPTIGKGGMGIGGAYGKGRVYRGDTAVGDTSVTKISIGIQLGGQSFSQIIFFENRESFKDFTSGNFEFDATASAVAITAGAQAEAGTKGSSVSKGKNSENVEHKSGEYYKGMAIFTYIKGGLMYEASIAGQKFKYKPY